MKNKTGRKILPVIGMAVLLMIFITACGSEQEQKVGKLVSYRASFSMQDMASGEVRDLYFEGILVIELEDGEKVDAVVDEQLAKTLRGHDRVIIEPIEPIEVDNREVEWEVVSLAE